MIDTVDSAYAERFLKCSRMTLYRLIRRGEIPAAKVGIGYVFRRSDLEAYLDRKMNKHDVSVTATLSCK